MGSQAPRPPGPLFQRTQPPTFAALLTRVSVGATLIAVVWIAFQASQMGPRPSAQARGARAGVTLGGVGAASVSGTAVAVETGAGGGVSASSAGAAPGEAGGGTGVASAAMGGASGDSAPPVPRPPPKPRDPRVVAFHGLLDAVTDFDDVAQNRAYAILADHVRNLKDDEAARVLRTDLDYPTLVSHPADVRGELVRKDGLLIRLEPVRLVPGAGPAGVEDAWRGLLMDVSGDECWAFDLVGDAPDVSKRDLVRVEGAFLKVYRYEAGKGDRDVPFLLARTVRRLEEAEVERAFRWDYVAVGLVGLVAAFMLIQRKQSQDEMAMVNARKLEEERKKWREMVKETAAAKVKAAEAASTTPVPAPAPPAASVPAPATDPAALAAAYAADAARGLFSGATDAPIVSELPPFPGVGGAAPPSAAGPGGATGAGGASGQSGAAGTSGTGGVSGSAAESGGAPGAGSPPPAAT